MNNNRRRNFRSRPQKIILEEEAAPSTKATTLF